MKKSSAPRLPPAVTPRHPKMKKFRDDKIFYCGVASKDPRYQRDYRALILTAGTLILCPLEGMPDKQPEWKRLIKLTQIYEVLVKHSYNGVGDEHLTALILKIPEETDQLLVFRTKLKKDLEASQARSEGESPRMLELRKKKADKNAWKHWVEVDERNQHNDNETFLERLSKVWTYNTYHSTEGKATDGEALQLNVRELKDGMGDIDSNLNKLEGKTRCGQCEMRIREIIQSKEELMVLKKKCADLGRKVDELGKVTHRSDHYKRQMEQESAAKEYFARQTEETLKAMDGLQTELKAWRQFFDEHGDSLLSDPRAKESFKKIMRQLTE